MQKKENNSSCVEGQAANDIHDELERLCSGLSYRSETDAPIEVFIGQSAEKSDWNKILEQLCPTDSEAIEEVTIEAFFEKLTTVREWYTADQIANAGRHEELKKYLQDSLSDLRVFRIGKIQIDIFVIGFDPEGRVVGIKTKAVET